MASTRFLVHVIGLWKSGASYKPAAVDSPLPSHHQILIDRPLSVASITNKVSSSSAKMRIPHQISPPLRSPLHQISPPLRSPLHHFPATLPIPIHSLSEGSLMANNIRRTQTKQTKQNQRMSFIARYPAMTTDWRDLM